MVQRLLHRDGCKLRQRRVQKRPAGCRKPHPLYLVQPPAANPPEKPWAVKGTPETQNNLISSIYLEPDDLEKHERKLEQKYKLAQMLETRLETYMTDDAEILLVGYGIVSRVLRSAVDEARAQGLRAGLLRPITLWPFPSKALAETAARCKTVLTVEMSTGQMVEDVRLAINGKVPVELYSRIGGNVPSVEEVHARMLECAGAEV